MFEEPMQNPARSRLPRLFIPPPKDHVENDSSAYLSPQGTLSPDIHISSPPSFPPTPSHEDQESAPREVSQIGRFFLASPHESQGKMQLVRAVHMDTQQQYFCKVMPLEVYRQTLSAYWRVGSHEHINEIEEIILGETQAYVFFPGHYGDLHSYVRSKKRLRESQAVALFEQIVSAAAHCHENGVVLRDLKLRKFVFKDAERTQLKLEGLEDACVLDDDDNDLLEDKHGCPAYVSPEILDTSHMYSGRAADSWSLGVMLYTMLSGRYPFHDTDASVLFSKIRRGQFTVPDNLSSRARCLIRSLLRRQPDERLAASEALSHPWFSYKLRAPVSTSKNEKKELDQTVPSLDFGDESLFS